MENRSEVIVIAAETASLGVGLAAALGAKGWAPVQSNSFSALTSSVWVPTVLVVEDDDGYAPKVLSPGGPGACVCVGSVRSLAPLIPIAEHGSVVLNAETPFVLLVQLVDEALRRLWSNRPPDAESAARLRRRVAERNALARLTAAESETLQALMDGETATEIAGYTAHSVYTVRTHIKDILRKLGVNSQLAAVALAERTGFFAAVEARRAQFGGSVRSDGRSALGVNAPDTSMPLRDGHSCGPLRVAGVARDARRTDRP